MTEPAAPAKRPGRAPGVMFAGFAAILVVFVTSAFTPAQPPPPPTAEFAPAASKPITIAPPDQTSQNGPNDGTGTGGKRGPGAGKGKAPTPSSSPSTNPSLPPVIAPPTSFRCIGSPPRQIDDPESPPCVTTVVKNNGGATATGVDANTIRIAIPDGDSAEVAALLHYFNQNFNFYGRTLTFTPTVGCFGGGTPQQMRSAADTIAQKKVFASVGYCDAKGTEYPLYDELAAKHVVSVSNRPNIQTEKQLAAHHPYEWTFWAPYDVGTTHVANLACTLANKAAQYAGAPLNQQTRKFGLFYNTFTDAPSPDLTAFRDRLAACGISLTDEAGIPADRNGGVNGTGYSSDSVQQINAALLKMKGDGVTTLIDLLHPDTAKTLFQECSSQNYEPEQVISSYLYLDADSSGQIIPSDQQPHTFGISVWNRFIHPQEEYWYQAIKEGDPSYSFPSAQFNYYGAWYLYYPLLTLASGIQMAGPDLTPESFARGIQGAAYPNPTVAGHVEGRVTIKPGQHSYITSASVIWDTTTPDPDYAAPSTYCYVGAGRRYELDDYPKGFSLFSGPCGRYG